jgi:serine/threonine protein kinase
VGDHHHTEASPAQLVRQLRDEQARCWRQGQPVAVETYLQRFPTLANDPDAILDLIYNEFSQRVLLGHNPQPDDYLARFPRLRERLERQFAVHQAFLAELLPAEVAMPRPAPEGDDPESIGKYRVIVRLDSGGQGTVYRAVHPTLGLEVAIKVSGSLVANEPRVRDRLQQEARLLAEVSHPNLARVLDLDVWNGHPFLVMEYVRGRNLEQYVRQGRLKPREAAAIVAQIATALASVHRRGIVHQDLKPQNILLDESGTPRLIDFGLALLQSSLAEVPPLPGIACGSPPYMAPEQARGQAELIGPRTDLFGLGAVLYFLLVGQPPYPSPNAPTALARAVSGEWDRAALERAVVPSYLKTICRRALAEAPSERYASAEELAAALDAWLRRPRRAVVLAAAFGAAILLLVLVALYLVLRRSEGPFSPATSAPATTPRIEAANAPVSPLRLRVRRKNQFFDLINVVPLQTGTELSVEATIPPQLHGSLLLVSGKGRVQALRELDPQTEAAALDYPPAGQGTVPLQGPGGTECMLVIGRRSGPVKADELQRWLGEAGAWSALSGKSVLRLRRERVEVEQSDRDFGAPRADKNPEAEVVRRLEALRSRLRERADYFEGLAFAHQE